MICGNCFGEFRYRDRQWSGKGDVCLPCYNLLCTERELKEVQAENKRLRDKVNSPPAYFPPPLEPTTKELELEGEIEAMRERLATAQRERDFAREVMAYASGKREQDWMEGVRGTAETLVGSIVYRHDGEIAAKLATAQREAEEAQARLAMAVEALSKIESDKEFDLSNLEGNEGVWVCEYCGEVNQHGPACPVVIARNALTATAASVAQHAASVERRGAAKELKAITAEQQMVIDQDGEFCYMVPSHRLLARAAELEGA